MSGRTKSGPTVQADSATVSTADFSNSSAADLWSFMGSLLVSVGGRRRWCLRPALRAVVGRQLFEQPADVFERRDARLRVSQGTPPRSRLLPDPCRAAPAA